MKSKYQLAVGVITSIYYEERKKKTLTLFKGASKKNKISIHEIVNRNTLDKNRDEFHMLASNDINLLRSVRNKTLLKEYLYKWSRENNFSPCKGNFRRYANFAKWYKRIKV